MSRTLRVTGVRVLTVLCALADSAGSGVAQTGVVQGQVVDASSMRPLSDAQILIEGTGIGQLANASGRFELLNVPAGNQVVRVTLIGYHEAEQGVAVAPGQTLTVDIRLQSTAISLDELVVTGVGAETARRALGVSVEVVGAEEIAVAPVQSVASFLQGRVPGATVNATSAQPGTGSLINFRGVSSVFGAQTPVIYVDGVRMDNDQSTAAGTGGEQSSALADLLTTDIERVEVTKGGAASTLYGSDAATGVIQIFTKKGTPGTPRIVGRIEQGVEMPELKYILDTRLTFNEEVEAGEVIGTFMEEVYFKTGHTQNYYVGVTGGTADMTYSVSGRMEEKDGTQPKDGSTNYSLRGGLRASLTNNFTFEFSGSYVRHNFDRLYNGAAVADPLTTFEVGDALYFSQASTLQGAMDIFLLPEITEWVNRSLVSGTARWQIRDDLGFRFTLGTDSRTNQQRTYEPIGFIPGERTGELRRFDRSFTSVSLDAGLTYNWRSAAGVVGTATSIGMQGFRDDESTIVGRGRTFALPGTFDFGSAAQIVADEGNVELFSGGVYVDEQVSVWDKLYVGAGFRIDAASSFGDNIDYEFYPKATGSYIISEDVPLSFVDEFKLRTAYGQAGNFPGNFLKDRTFSATSFRGESAPRFANPGNAELRAETTSTIEVGVDAALLDNRVGLNFTWYDAVTYDALFQVPRQPVTGQGTQQENVGQIRNTGVEIAATFQLLNQHNLAWSAGGSFQWVHNRVTDMGGVADFAVDGSQKWVTEDLPVGTWRLTTPIDTNNDTLPDASQRVYTGNHPVPDKSGGFHTTLSLGNSLTVSALADWAGGHHVFDFGSVWATFNNIYRLERLKCGLDWLDPNLPENPPDGPTCGFSFPVLFDSAGVGLAKYSQTSARSAFLYDGDYFKIREVSVRYVLPDRIVAWVGLARATVYGTGQNLWIWSRNPLIDGELSGLNGGGLELGSENSITLPPNRTFRLGVEVVF